MIELSKEQEAVLDVLSLRHGSVKVKQGRTPNTVEMTTHAVSWVVMEGGRIIDQSQKVFTCPSNSVREDAYSDLVPDQEGEAT